MTDSPSDARVACARSFSARSAASKRSVVGQKASRPPDRERDEEDAATKVGDHEDELDRSRRFAEAFRKRGGEERQPSIDLSDLGLGGGAVRVVGGGGDVGANVVAERGQFVEDGVGRDPLRNGSIEVADVAEIAEQPDQPVDIVDMVASTDEAVAGRVGQEATAPAPAARRRSASGTETATLYRS